MYRHGRLASIPRTGRLTCTNSIHFGTLTSGTFPSNEREMIFEIVDEGMAPLVPASPCACLALCLPRLGHAPPPLSGTPAQPGPGLSALAPLPGPPGLG
jgi:hypothetical protein